MARGRRQRSALALQRSGWSLSGLIDQGFFLLAGVASFWLAWLVWCEGWESGGWWMVVLFVAVWAITAYLALPRLHRILSSLYVPNYFIGRTRTADGLLGDPVNLALRGSEAQLHAAMTAAGWTLADDITPRSAWRMVQATLLRRSYPQAPVSSLFLFGRRQDIAYQQEIDGNPSKRHHVRFWRCPQGWLLPGGHRVDWLAAGTYDKSVGLSLFTLQITHKIDENTDIERDYIVQTVTAAMPAVTVTNLEDFSTGYHSRNGGGDMIQTDGDLPVLELGRLPFEETKVSFPEVILDATSPEAPSELHDTLIWQLWSHRPPQIALGVVLIVIAMLVSLLNAVAVESIAWMIGVVILLRLVFYGSAIARIILLAITSMTALISAMQVTLGTATGSPIGTLFFIGINIGVVLLFSSDAARRFTRAHSQRPQWLRRLPLLGDQSNSQQEQ